MHNLWESSFFSECFKFEVDFRNKAKIQKGFLYFLDNCIGIGCGRFSLLSGVYFSLVVNVLISSPKISDVTKRDIFQLNVSQSDEELS